MLHNVWFQYLTRIRFAPRRANLRSLRARLESRRIESRLEALEVRVLPAATPLVTAFFRSSPTTQDTSASSVTYGVIFNESVTGVDASDFKVTTKGGVGFANPLVVS